MKPALILLACLAFPHPARAVDLNLRSGGIIGFEWDLHADEDRGREIGAGHGFAVFPPFPVHGSDAVIRTQISGELLGLGDGPSLELVMPISSSLPEFNNFWIDGESNMGSYSGFVQTVSGFPPPPVAAESWIIDVLPTGDEALGTPTRVTVRGMLKGLLTATGNGWSGISWRVSTDRGNGMGGSWQTFAGEQPIQERGAIDFVLPLGHSFELFFDYRLDVAGSGTAGSRAEIISSLVGVSAVVVPEPTSLALLSLGVAISVRFIRRKRTIVISSALP